MQENHKDKKGIKIMHFNAILTVCIVLLCVVLLFTTVTVSRKYDNLMDSTEEYIVWGEKGALVHDTSDFLTEQVRLFAQTGDREYMENYFLEVYYEKKRETILNEAKDYYSEPDVVKYLEIAVGESNRLMLQEYYAMKLVCTAYDLPEMYIPSEVKRIELQAKDMELSAEEMLKKGQSLLYDEDYQKSKDIICENVDLFLNEMLAMTKGEQENSSSDFFKAIISQRSVIILIIILNVFAVLGILFMVGVPMKRFSSRIKEHTLLDVAGVRELKELAAHYNQMYETSFRDYTDYKYIPQIDPLTGAMNHETFKEVICAIEDNNEAALIVVQVDQFEWLVDTYGVGAGGWILKKAASVISKEMRGKDYLFRIAKDEFAMILKDVTEEDKHKLERIFMGINHILQNPTDGLPSFTVSAGVAFTINGLDWSMSGKAHEALAQARKIGQKQMKYYET